MSQDKQLSIKQILLKKQAILESRLKLHNIERNFEDYANDICYFVGQKQELSKCTSDSIVDSALQAAKAGLYVGGNVTHLVPFGDKCILQIGYEGYTILLGRVMPIKQLYYDVVYEDDEFTYEQTEEMTAQGLTCIGVAKRKRGKSKKIKGAFSHTVLSDGNSFVLYMDISEIDKYKPRTSSGNFWGRWDEEMYASRIRKIQHRKLLKWYAPAQSQAIIDIAADDETSEIKMANPISEKTINTSEAFDINPSEVIVGEVNEVSHVSVEAATNPVVSEIVSVNNQEALV